MMAINGGKGERATLLIRAGADVTKVNAAGLSAFHIAAAKPALIQLKQLAQAGAESIDGLRAACSHLREGRMTWRIQNGNLIARFQLKLIGTNMLRDTACFA